LEFDNVGDSIRNGTFFVKWEVVVAGYTALTRMKEYLDKPGHDGVLVDPAALRREHLTRKS
jgi:hypothetical protein